MQNTDFDICIIGAGASGLVSAIESSRRGLSCVVVDKNKKPGNKLYATGNGRCNLTNDDYDDDTYYGNEFVDSVYESLYKSCGMRQRSFVVNYFNKLGVNTVSKDGYIYPSSLQASTIVWALTDTAISLGCRIVNRATAISVEKEDMYKVNLLIRQDGEEQQYYVKARNIIIATGGLSQEKLGAATRDQSDSLLSSLDVPYNEYESALCPVILNDDVKQLSGVRTKCKVSVDGHSELGELQITDTGFSGIVVFDLSYYMKPGDVISVNLLPKVSEEDFVQRFNEIKNSFPNKRLDLFLNGYLNDKLAVFMIKRFYGETEMNLTLKDVTETGIRGLYQEIVDWKSTIRCRAGFDQSQASSGGIMTAFINPKTMQLRPEMTLGQGIYATGEATDVLGKCGGYNLTYAFVTGFLAGNSVR